MSFTSSRALHSLGVAKLMQFWSNELGGFDPDEMFVLGWLHDVGYAIAWGDNETRTKVGAFLLSMLGYSGAPEIESHGNATPDDSVELQLLNLADMSINSRGDRDSFQDRRRDISERYGEDSIQVRRFDDCLSTAKKYKIYQELMSKGLLDDFD